MAKQKENKIGYILRCNAPNGVTFALKESTYTHTINYRGDKIRSKMLLFPVDYDDVVENTEIIANEGLILVGEPFFLNDSIRSKVTRWIAWANEADPSEYDFFHLLGHKIGPMPREKEKTDDR